MAPHVPATRELHLGRRDLLHASTVKDSLNALPGFKTSAGELHVHELSFAYTFTLWNFGILEFLGCENEPDEQLSYIFCKLYWWWSSFISVF
jgi:hypothetical protein